MNDLGLAIRGFKRDAFRLELLDEYKVASEWDEYQAYLGGRPLPDLGSFQSWLDGIAKATAEGRTWSRVHVVPTVLTPYLKFEIDWGYLYSARAGERVHILLDTAYEKLKPAGFNASDYWLFDDRVAFEMIYGDDGSFKEAKEVQDSGLLDRYRALKGVLLTHAQPLEKFLAGYRLAETRVS